MVFQVCWLHHSMELRQFLAPKKKENGNSLVQSTTKCYAWLTTIPKLLWKWQIFHDIRSNFSFPFGHTHTHAVYYVDIFHTQDLHNTQYTLNYAVIIAFGANIHPHNKRAMLAGAFLIVSQYTTIWQNKRGEKVPYYFCRIEMIQLKMNVFKRIALYLCFIKYNSFRSFMSMCVFMPFEIWQKTEPSKSFEEISGPNGFAAAESDARGTKKNCDTHSTGRLTHTHTCHFICHMKRRKYHFITCFIH